VCALNCWYDLRALRESGKGKWFCGTVRPADGVCIGVRLDTLPEGERGRVGGIASNPALALRPRPKVKLRGVMGGES